MNNITKFLIAFGIMFILFNIYLIEKVGSEESVEFDLKSKINILENQNKLLSNTKRDQEIQIANLKESLDKERAEYESERQSERIKEKEELKKKSPQKNNNREEKKPELKKVEKLEFPSPVINQNQKKDESIDSAISDDKNSNKLVIHLIPHCHLDAGWLSTMEEYYQKEVKSIINTLIPALESHPDRRFVWVEISYLNRWWIESSKDDQQRFVNLVKSGQIELVMGGKKKN